MTDIFYYTLVKLDLNYINKNLLVIITESYIKQFIYLL